MRRVLAAKVIAKALGKDGPGIEKLSTIKGDGLDGVQLFKDMKADGQIDENGNLTISGYAYLDDLKSHFWKILTMEMPKPPAQAKPEKQRAAAAAAKG